MPATSWCWCGGATSSSTALVRALKRESIEVAGVDRLNLGEELAIQDLLAMARFVLLPQDDLNLACLLKSPLVGLGEDAALHLGLEAHRPSLACPARARRRSTPSPPPTRGCRPG